MAPLEFLKDPEWRRETLNDGFGKGFYGFLAAAILTGALCWLIKGSEEFWDALIGDVGLLAGLMPRVCLALSIAALIWFLLPRDRIAALVGTESGIMGLIIATVAGTVTPGGPSSAFALLAVMAGAGADRGAMVSYITAWGMLGLQRVLVWDVPFMGAEFALLRLGVCLPLAILAGMIARKLPFELKIKEHKRRGTTA